MKLKLISLAVLASAVAMASCSDDSVVGEEPELPSTQNNQIAYSVTADRQTRAAAVYNSNTLPKMFHISAWLSDKTAPTSGGDIYIKWDLIQDEGTPTQHNWVNKEYPRYWPSNGDPLTFYATNATEAEFANPEKGIPDFTIPFTTQSDPTQQTDLLYAATYNQVHDASTTTAQTVDINFHHALSQVVFTAQCPNDKLEVAIESVSLCGVNPSGTLMVPPTAGPATWAVAAKATPASFTMLTQRDDGSAAVAGDDVTPLTSSSSQIGQALMLMPQTSAAADPKNITAGGTYLKVHCQVVNIADPTGEHATASDRLVFGKDEGMIFLSDDLYIPLPVNWQMGKRYVYNLDFGSGNGGYDKEGNPVMFAVNYNVTVDDWQEVNSSTISASTSN